MKDCLSSRVEKLQWDAIEVDNPNLELIEDLYEAVINRDKLIAGMSTSTPVNGEKYLEYRVKIACSLIANDHEQRTASNIVRQTEKVLQGLLNA